jgi:DNA-binding IclR family transcriptional regulator
MTGDGSVQVLAKAASVLDRLAMEQEASAGQLAGWIEEPRSTVYRLLASLRRLGFVEPGSRPGSYRLGLELFRLGSAVLTRFDERQAALPVMERIHEETGETVFLCVRRGLEAVCIERLDGRRVQSLALRLGGSLPLHAGAAPRVLLAYEPHEVWREYLSAASLEPFTARTPTTGEQLVPMLEEIRDVGYAVSDEDVTVGIAAVGAPIFDYRGALRAALSISGLRSSILGEDPKRIRALIVQGARDVSRALGHGMQRKALADA